MPDKLIAASALETALFLVGCVLFWLLFLSGKARARSQLPWPLPHWDIPGYVFGLSILRLIGVTLVFQLMVSTLLKKYAPELSLTEGLGLLLSGFSLQVGLLFGLGVCWLLLKSNRFQARLNAASSPPEILPPPLTWARVPLVGFSTFLIMVAVIAPVVLIWPQLLDWMGYPATQQEVVELFTQSNSRLEISLIVLFAVVIAPVTEEVLFRAGIFRYLRGRLPRAVVFILPAVLFAIAHRSVAAGLPMFIFGIIQQIAYERTGRIAVPMIAHGLFNLHTALFILADVDPYSPLREWLF